MKKIILSTINADNEFPLALYYLKSYAENHPPKNKEINKNYEIKVKDFFKESNEEIAKELIKENPDIIAFSSYIWNVKKIQEISNIIRTNTKVKDNLKIWIGGPDIEESHLTKKIDVLIKGEGEETFVELLINNLQENSNSNLKKIKGLIYKDKEEKTKFSGLREPLEIDSIPSPFLNNTVSLEKLKEYKYILYETRRGCIFKCGFCKEAYKSDKIRYFSLDRIDKELKYLITNNLAVEIIDPYLNTSKERTLKLCNIIAKYNNNSITWVPLVYYSLDKETIEALRKANINRVEIGLQSINKETLKNVNKLVDIEKFKEKISLFDDYFKVHIDLINGLPGDNYFTFVRTLNFCVNLGKRILVEKLSVDNYTPLRENAEKLKLKFETEPPYLVIENYSFSKKEIRKSSLMTSSFLKEYNSYLD